MPAAALARCRPSLTPHCPVSPTAQSCFSAGRHFQVGRCPALPASVPAGINKKSCLRQTRSKGCRRQDEKGNCNKSCLIQGQDRAGVRECYLAFFFSFFSLRFSLRLFAGSFFLSFLVTSPFVIALNLWNTTYYHNSHLWLSGDLKIGYWRQKYNRCWIKSEKITDVTGGQTGGDRSPEPEGKKVNPWKSFLYPPWISFGQIKTTGCFFIINFRVVFKGWAYFYSFLITCWRCHRIDHFSDYVINVPGRISWAGLSFSRLSGASRISSFTVCRTRESVWLTERRCM